MEQHANKIPRLRRTQTQIEQLLIEFEKSDSGVAEFCALHTVSKATFHKWKSRYRNKVKKSFKAGGFSRLKIAVPVNPQEVLFAEVNGIKLYQPVAASYLKDLTSL